MSKIFKYQKLIGVSDQEKRDVCKEIGITLDEYWQFRQRLIEYIDRSEHLPKDYDAALLAGCVFNTKANLEKAKKLLDNYYRCKNDYGEKLYDHCIPGTKKYKEALELTFSVCTRKLTPAPTPNRVYIIKLNDPEGKVEDAFIYTIAITMQAEIRGNYDFWASTIVICDMEHLNVKNVYKMSAQWVFAMKDIFESLEFRIQGIHFVNGRTILEKVLHILRVMLPAKLTERVYVHSDYESLQKVVPKECLPKDYGGYDNSIKELQEEWNDAMEEHTPFFERCRAAKGTKKYKFDDEQRESMGIGVDGSFKKLVID